MGYLNVKESMGAADSTTTSTSLVDASSNVTLVAEDTTTDFFVAYRGTFGGNDASQVGEAQCITGAATILGLSTAESNGTGTSYGGGQLQGFARYTKPSGADTVKLQHRCVTSSDTNRLGAQGIIMIPLDQALIFDVDLGVQQEHVPLIEGADFFYTGTNSATAVATSIGNTWTSVGPGGATEPVFNIPSAGDYRVFFSVETTLTSGSTSDGHQARFQIAGTTQGPEWVREWENNSDRINFGYTDQVALSAGATTFRIQVQNRNANSTLSAYRTRIWAFRAETFLAGATDVETTGDNAITHTSYSDSEIFLAASYTGTLVGGSPHVAFATVNLASSGTGIDTLVEIRDEPATGGTGRCLNSGFGYNDAGLDSGDDLMPTVVFQTGSSGMGATDGHRVRTKISAAGTGTAGRNAGNTGGVRNNLFLWPMFVREQDLLPQDGGGVLATER